MSLPPPHGLVLVNKPAGVTSAAVVGRLKHALRQAGYPLKGPGRVAIGHGGTLDPFATGLLPIGLGRGTKALQALLHGSKTYQFTLQFGTQTTTADLTGTPTHTHAHRPSAAAVAAVVPQFIGALSQVPPAFSALKVQGQRAYALARQGQPPVLAPRPVTIHSLAVVGTSGPAAALSTATFTATVSKGTYIRTLGEDIAKALGTVGHVAVLCRTAVGPYQLSQAQPPEILDTALKIGQIHPYLYPLPAPAGVEHPTSGATY